MLFGDGIRPGGDSFNGSSVHISSLQQRHGPIHQQRWDQSEAPLLLVSNTLYCTCNGGGLYGYGTVFRVNTDGSAFTNLHSFSSANNLSSTNTDGARPVAGLILSSNVLYGITSVGGTHALGSIFKVNTDGSGFTNFYNFASGSFGTGLPQGGMVLLSNVLYGTGSQAGSGANGAVFSINTDGTGYTNLHSFSLGTVTNKDGASPNADLLLVGNTLFGTSSRGGSGDAGTVFRLNTDGTAFTNLHSFVAVPPIGYALDNTNSEGCNPYGGLVISGNTLYGTTLDGGINGAGVIYKVNTDGTGFTNFYTFTKRDFFSGTNIDGAYPYGNLVLSGGKLYGTASAGGTHRYGTIFSIGTNGTGFIVLAYLATSNSAPAAPNAGLTQSGSTFYGTGGNVFALGLTLPAPAPLNFQSSGGQLIFSWSNAAFTLQSATSLNGSFSDVPGATSPYTNSATTNAQLFYRLQSGVQ